MRLSARDWLQVKFANLRFADLESFAAHVVRLAKANVRPLVSGSMGEAIHLSHAERTTLIKTARAALDDAGLTDVPIIAGTGAGSTRETILLSQAAAEAGADYVIVICSGYFAGALAGNRKALKAFWSEVSEKSPIPVLIYNCEYQGPLRELKGTEAHSSRSRCCWRDRLGLGLDHGVSGRVPKPGWCEAHVRCGFYSSARV